MTQDTERIVSVHTAQRPENSGPVTLWVTVYKGHPWYGLAACDLPKSVHLAMPHGFISAGTIESGEWGLGGIVEGTPSDVEQLGSVIAELASRYAGVSRSLQEVGLNQPPVRGRVRFIDWGRDSGTMTSIALAIPEGHPWQEEQARSVLAEALPSYPGVVWGVELIEGWYWVTAPHIVEIDDTDALDLARGAAKRIAEAAHGR